MKNHIFTFILLVWVAGLAQIPDNIKLPEGGKQKADTKIEEHFSFYITKDDQVFDKNGERKKNPYEIADYITKHQPQDTTAEKVVYLHIDKRTRYTTVNTIKNQIARAGIYTVFYITQPMDTSLNGYKFYLPQLSTKTQIKDTSKKKPVELPKNRKPIFITLLGGNKVSCNGKTMALTSKRFKNLIASYNFINLDFTNDLRYNAYIEWLGSITAYNEEKRKTGFPLIVLEMLPDLKMKDKNKGNSVGISTSRYR